MAFSKFHPATDSHYIADTIADLENVHSTSMGDTCYVIENGKTYTANSKGEWICPDDYIPPIQDSVEKQEIDLSNYVTVDMLKSTLNQPKYEIRNCPKATTIDYRGKEIRIFCHDNAEYQKQNVGEGGNPNMYYMTFRAYAPEGAFYLKEGDKGVILDEEISLYGGSGTGVTADGRRFKDHWFALAMYDEASDSWTYFGKNSNTSKYLGWTYIVEWYDKNGVMLDTDSVRINLSNKECHNALQFYFG